jgi:peptidyl-prolyl cis-trans isomerase SurA
MVDSRGHREVITQTRARHILVKPSAIRNEQQTIALAERLRERAQEGESFRDLARRYSEDIGSAQEGGDLGWVSPGQLVTEFEEVMQRTEPGEISEPVHTQFGWHVILVEDRRQQDVTREMRRQIARNVLHERKFEDELEIWMRNLRDEAFVDIKL